MEYARPTSSVLRSLGALTSLLTAALVLAACAAGSTARQALFLPSSASPMPSTAVPVKSPPPAVGMTQGDLVLLSEAQLNRELDVVRDAGATWIRIDIDWAIIEPTRGTRNWATTDRVVQAARSRGLAVLGLITYAPRWAQDSSVPPGTSHGRPATPELFGAFAGRTGQHYKDQISSWEIWNEPNLDLFFEPRPDPYYYTDLLRASHDALHAVDPTATVVAGSAAPAVDTPDGKRLSPKTFIDRMYAAGAKNSLDAVSVHPYSYPASPSDGGTAAYNTFQQIPALYATMQSYGDGAKLLWLTEFGAPSAAVATGTGPVTIDDQRQATIIGDGLHSAAQLGYIGPVFIYSIRDEATGDTNTLKNFGIVHADFTPKPSFTVIQQYARGR